MAAAPTVPATERLNLDQLVERVRILAPRWRERALATERNRAPLPVTMQELFESGLMRMFQPARFGGYALGWDAPIVLGREIARVCPSTAWMVAVVGPHACWVGRFAEAAQDDVWRDGSDQLICGAMVAKGGRIRRDGEGYRVDGAFGFASGIDHARWGFVIGPLEGEGEQVCCLLPRRDWEIDDTWHVAGMRGTGTKDLVARNAFVPMHRAIPTRALLAADPPGSAVNPDAIYRVEYPSYIGSSLLGPILGAAEGGLEAYAALTCTRTGAMFGERVADAPTVQVRFSESSAAVRAATLMAEDQARFLTDCARHNRPVPEQDRVALARDRAYVTRLCVEAIERLVKHMGAMGLYDDNPVQRFHRDLSAMAQQIGVNWDRNMMPYGKWALSGPQQAHSNWR